MAETTTTAKDKALDFKGSDFGMDLEWNPSGPILNDPGRITVTNVDGTALLYDNSAFVDKGNRVAWANFAMRFGFDKYIETSGPKFRLDFRPVGLSVRSGKFRVNPGEDGSAIYTDDGNTPSQQDLHTLTATEISYSAAIEAGVEIPTVQMPVGVSATLDVGGMILSNPKTGGFYMTGAYNPHNRSWNQDINPAVARVGIGPKIGFFSARFVFDLPIDQSINLGKQSFEANGESHNVMGLSGPDNIPYGLTRAGKSFELSFDVAEFIRWIAKQDQPRRERRAAAAEE